MNNTCPFSGKCKYYKQYRTSNEMMHNGMIEIFCKGEDYPECVLFGLLQNDQELPSDRMLPTGNVIRGRT